MRRSRHTLGFFVAALLGALSLAPPAFAGKADNSVRFAFDQTLPAPDPYYNNQLIGAIFADSVWDTLIYRDPKSRAYVGALATGWRWIDDATLELELRRGVKFHDGAAFDADDVVYTLSFVTDPKNGATNQGLAGQIARVAKVDAYKVRIVFKGRFPAALSYLSSPASVIHPRAYYARVGPGGVNAHPVGTGPYRVLEHARGKYIRLERNPDYFIDSPKSRPKIEKVEIRFIPDAQTRVAEMVAGGLDLTTRVDADQAAQLRGLPSIEIVAAETTGYAYLQMNSLPSTPAPPLRDIRVRQAIMHAIDREAMVTYLVGEGSRVRGAECHPSDFGCDDEHVPRYPYDPEKARRLLAEAGYQNGFDIDVYAFRDRIQTEAIVNYLRAVGIGARMRFLQAAALQSAVQSGRAALVHGTWSAFGVGDVSATVSRYHKFTLYDMNRDPEIRDLLVRADAAMDQQARKQDYARAFALIAERAYTLPLYSLPTYYIAAKDLSYTPHADAILRFYEMSWK